MKLLVIRFSSLGDVAMTVPVVDALARTYPNVDITVLSRPFAQPFFTHMPANVHFRCVKLTDYKGVDGLFRLFRELRREGPFDRVADLHDVLRSRILRLFFHLTRTRVEHIHKGRRDRRALMRPRQKVRKQLPSSFQRYADVFRRLGLPVQTHFRSIYGTGQGDTRLFHAVAGEPDGRTWIGFAPFAAHRGKQLPEATSQALIRLLAGKPATHLFLLGGKEHKEQLQQWGQGLPNVTLVAGQLDMEAELSLISHLDVMISMDSANMHLASLVGTPVVSVWGATHPLAGFMGWGQSEANAVQCADLPCRPCSIFGNKPCLRGDYACLTRITPEEIANKAERIQTQKKS